jgi:hypothetical protein
MRGLFLPLLAVSMLLLISRAQYAHAEEELTAEMMKVALHTATPQEHGFIQYVLDKVDEGVLPMRLVQSTFLWAKKKPTNKFFYFKRGLILRAAKEGIKL